MKSQIQNKQTAKPSVDTSLKQRNIKLTDKEFNKVKHFIKLMRGQ